MNTDDPDFKTKARAIVRDLFINGDDENAVRLIRDCRLFEGLADVAAANCAISIIQNQFENSGYQEVVPQRPITGLRLALHGCIVLAGAEEDFVIRQLPDGVVEVYIRNMIMTSEVDASPQLQAERVAHARTRNLLDACRARLVTAGLIDVDRPFALDKISEEQLANIIERLKKAAKEAR